MLFLRPSRPRHVSMRGWTSLVVTTLQHSGGYPSGFKRSRAPFRALPVDMCMHPDPRHQLGSHQQIKCAGCPLRHIKCDCSHLRLGRQEVHHQVSIFFYKSSRAFNLALSVHLTLPYIYIRYPRAFRVCRVRTVRRALWEPIFLRGWVVFATCRGF